MPLDKDPMRMLLGEILKLQGEIKPLEDRLDKAKKLFKDYLIKTGPMTDEDLGVTAYLKDRNKTEYDTDLLRQNFPELGEGVIFEQVDADRMKQAIAIGEVTESELDALGIRIRTTISKALTIEPIRGGRA